MKLLLSFYFVAPIVTVSWKMCWRAVLCPSHFRSLPLLSSGLLTLMRFSSHAQICPVLLGLFLFVWLSLSCHTCSHVLEVPSRGCRVSSLFPVVHPQPSSGSVPVRCDLVALVFTLSLLLWRSVGAGP